MGSLAVHIAVEGNGKLMPQQQLVESIVHVDRALDQDPAGFDPVDRIGDNASAPRAVMADADVVNSHRVGYSARKLIACSVKRFPRGARLAGRFLFEILANAIQVIRTVLGRSSGERANDVARCR